MLTDKQFSFLFQFLIENGIMAREDQMEMVVINRMLKELQAPQKDEGFDELKIIDG